MERLWATNYYSLAGNAQLRQLTLMNRLNILAFMKTCSCARFMWLFVFLVCVCKPVSAVLVIVINDASPTRFSFSLSGTLDENATGDQAQWIAIKPDWSTNYATHVEWMDSSLGSANVTEKTIQFSGHSIFATYI